MSNASNIDNGIFMNSVLATEITESLDQADEEKEEIIRQIKKWKII